MTEAKIFTVTDANGQDMTGNLENFARFIGLDQAAPGRYSMLLVLGLFGGLQSGFLQPAKVINEIKALEGKGKPSQLKPPIQNKYPPLKGLWHKHYLAGGLRSMARNLKNGLIKDGLPWLDQLVQDAERSGEERYITEEHVKMIVKDAVHDNWLRRASAAELTGEWIIFAKHDDRNYYLALASHDQSGHDMLRSQINALCCHEFPFLKELLDQA